MNSPPIGRRFELQFVLALLVFASSSPSTFAQETDQALIGSDNRTTDDPLHDEIRALRDGLLEATNKGDLEGMLTFCHPNIRWTTPDRRVHKGHEGVRAYYEETVTGPTAVVKSFKADVKVDDLAVLYGDHAAVATGTSDDEFELNDGSKFVLSNRWSATLVKENGKWLVANYHTATSVFDNPLLDMAKKSLYWTGGVALIAGLVGGAVAMTLLRKPKPEGA